MAGKSKSSPLKRKFESIPTGCMESFSVDNAVAVAKDDSGGMQ
jgi:hypothetical protein